MTLHGVGRIRPGSIPKSIPFGGIVPWELHPGFPREETMRKIEDPTAKHILVADLGGGTFDACIVRKWVEWDQLDMLFTSGDERLGGNDFDNALVAWCLKMMKLFSISHLWCVFGLLMIAQLNDACHACPRGYSFMWPTWCDLISCCISLDAPCKETWDDAIEEMAAVQTKSRWTQTGCTQGQRLAKVFKSEASYIKHPKHNTRTQDQQCNMNAHALLPHWTEKENLAKAKEKSSSSDSSEISFGPFKAVVRTQGKHPWRGLNVHRFCLFWQHFFLVFLADRQPLLKMTSGLYAWTSWSGCWKRFEKRPMVPTYAFRLKPWRMKPCLLPRRAKGRPKGTKQRQTTALLRYMIIHHGNVILHIIIIVNCL